MALFGRLRRAPVARTVDPDQKDPAPAGTAVPSAAEQALQAQAEALVAALKQAVTEPLYTLPLAEVQNRLEAVFATALAEDQVLKAERSVNYYLEPRVRNLFRETFLFRSDQLPDNELKTIVESYRAANPDVLEIQAADIVSQSPEYVVRAWLEEQFGVAMPEWRRVNDGDIDAEEFASLDTKFRQAVDAKRLTWQQLDLEVSSGLEKALRPRSPFLDFSLAAQMAARRPPPPLDAWRGLGLVVERRLSRTIEESYEPRFREIVAIKSERARIAAEQRAQEARVRREQQADVDWAPYYAKPSDLPPALTNIEPLPADSYTRANPQALAAAQQILDRLGPAPHRLALAELGQRLDTALAEVLSTDSLEKPRHSFSRQGHEYTLPYELSTALRSRLEPEFLFGRKRDPALADNYALEACAANPELLEVRSTDLRLSGGTKGLVPWIEKQIGLKYPMPDTLKEGQTLETERQAFATAVDAAGLEWKQLDLDEPFTVLQLLSQRGELSPLTVADIVARVAAHRQGRELTNLLYEHGERLRQERVAKESAEQAQRQAETDRVRRAEVSKDWAEVLTPDSPDVALIPAAEDHDAGL